jgi:hypothetical protein
MCHTHLTPTSHEPAATSHVAHSSLPLSLTSRHLSLPAVPYVEPKRVQQQDVHRGRRAAGNQRFFTHVQCSRSDAAKWQMMGHKAQAQVT